MGGLAREGRRGDGVMAGVKGEYGVRAVKVGE
jgi:hypothetical protein